MGSVASSAVLAKNLGAPNSDVSNASRQGHSKDTDGDFLSILGSFSGGMLPAFQVYNHGVAQKKPTNGSAIGRIREIKVGLPNASGKSGMALEQNAGDDVSSSRNANVNLFADESSKTVGGSSAIANKQSLSAKVSLPLQKGAMLKSQSGTTGDIEINVHNLPGSGDGNALRQKDLQVPQIVQFLNQSATKAHVEKVDSDGLTPVSVLPHAAVLQLSTHSFMNGTTNAVNEKRAQSLVAKNDSEKDSKNTNLSGIGIPSRSVVLPTQSVENINGSQGQVNMLDFSQPNWMSHFGQIASHIRNDNGGSIQVKVHPEGMGDLLISVSNSSAGLTIHVEANQFATAQWLGQQTSQLSNAVSQLGISVVNVQVGFGQANLGQSGNGHSNRKSQNNEQQVISVTGASDGQTALHEPVSLGDSGQVYRHDSSITFRA